MVDVWIFFFNLTLHLSELFFYGISKQKMKWRTSGWIQLNLADDADNLQWACRNKQTCSPLDSRQSWQEGLRRPTLQHAHLHQLAEWCAVMMATMPSCFFKRQTLIRSIVKSSVHSTPVPIVPLASEDSNISMSEGSIAECVTHWIDCAVYVTQIVKEVPQFLGNTARAGSQWFQKHQDVVRGPRDYKCKKNRWESFGSFLISFLLLCLFLLLLLMLKFGSSIS